MAVVVATYSIVVTVFGATLSTDVGTRRRWGRRFADRRPGVPGAGGAVRMRRTDHRFRTPSGVIDPNGEIRFEHRGGTVDDGRAGTARDTEVA